MSLRKKIFLSYFLGLSMGLLSFVLVFSYIDNKKDLDAHAVKSYAKMEQDQKNLQAENDQLNQEIEKLKNEQESLKAQLETQQVGSGEKNEETEEKNNPITVDIIIPQDINYDEIATILVENKVYPHKNDLLMLMEMINFDKYAGAKAISEQGIIADETGHKNILRQYDMQRYAIRKSLMSKNLIQNEEAFSKILYLFDNQTKIIPGPKTFGQNISLREIADILMSNPQ